MNQNILKILSTMGIDTIYGLNFKNLQLFVYKLQQSKKIATCEI